MAARRPLIERDPPRGQWARSFAQAWETQDHEEAARLVRIGRAKFRALDFMDWPLALRAALNANCAPLVEIATQEISPSCLYFTDGRSFLIWCALRLPLYGAPAQADVTAAVDALLKWAPLDAVVARPGADIAFPGNKVENQEAARCARDGLRLIHLAARHNALPLAQKLIELGANPSGFGPFPERLADSPRLGRHEKAEAFAIHPGTLATAPLHLSHAQPVDTQTPPRVSPLVLACEAGMLDTARFLSDTLEEQAERARHAAFGNSWSAPCPVSHLPSARPAAIFRTARIERGNPGPIIRAQALDPAFSLPGQEDTVIGRIRALEWSHLALETIPDLEADRQAKTSPSRPPPPADLLFSMDDFSVDMLAPQIDNRSHGLAFPLGEGSRAPGATDEPSARFAPRVALNVAKLARRALWMGAKERGARPSREGLAPVAELAAPRWIAPGAALGAFADQRSPLSRLAASLASREERVARDFFRAFAMLGSDPAALERWGRAAKSRAARSHASPDSIQVNGESPLAWIAAVAIVEERRQAAPKARAAAARTIETKGGAAQNALLALARVFGHATLEAPISGFGGLGVAEAAALCDCPELLRSLLAISGLPLTPNPASPAICAPALPGEALALPEQPASRRSGVLAAAALGNAERAFRAALAFGRWPAAERIHAALNWTELAQPEQALAALGDEGLAGGSLASFGSAPWREERFAPRSIGASAETMDLEARAASQARAIQTKALAAARPESQSQPNSALPWIRLAASAERLLLQIDLRAHSRAAGLPATNGEAPSAPDAPRAEASAAATRARRL